MSIDRNDWRKLIKCADFCSLYLKMPRENRPAFQVDGEYEPSAPRGMQDAQLQLERTRQAMRDGFKRKKQDRTNLANALMDLRDSLRRTLKDDPEQMAELGIRPRGRPRKGESRTPKPLLDQSDIGVLNRARDFLDLVKSSHATEVTEVLSRYRMAEVMWSQFSYSIKMHGRKQLEWHQAVERRNHIHDRLKRWCAAASLWVHRHHLNSEEAYLFAVRFREVFDKRFINHELREELAEILRQRAYRNRKSEEDRRKGRQSMKRLIKGCSESSPG